LIVLVSTITVRFTQLEEKEEEIHAEHADEARRLSGDWAKSFGGHRCQTRGTHVRWKKKGMFRKLNHQCYPESRRIHLTGLKRVVAASSPFYVSIVDEVV
jgi:hypothetical protein